MVFKKSSFAGIRFFLVGVFLMFSFSALVSAFGVGFVNSELNLPPGEVFDTSFSLQNYGEGAIDLTIEVVVEEGSQYMSLTGGSSFNVPAQGNVAVPVRIAVPSDARIGDNYEVKVFFRSIGEEGQGASEGGDTTIGFAINQRRSVGINVVEEPGKATTAGGSNALVWGIVIIVLIILLIWWFKKKKK